MLSSFDRLVGMNLTAFGEMRTFDGRNYRQAFEAGTESAQTGAFCGFCIAPEKRNGEQPSWRPLPRGLVCYPEYRHRN